MFPLLDVAENALVVVAKDLDASSLTGGEAEDVLVRVSKLSHLLDGIAAQAGRRVADTERYLDHGDVDAADMVGRVMGTSKTYAREAITTAAVLEKLPATAAALKAGMISIAQANKIAPAALANPAAEEWLLEKAADGMVALREACAKARSWAEDSAERAKRQQSKQAVRTSEDDDGMWRLDGRYTPEIGASLNRVLEDETNRLFRGKGKEDVTPIEAFRAQALASLILGATDGSRPAHTINHVVHVVADLEPLRRGSVRDGERCEIPGIGPVDPNWIRERIGDSFLTLTLKFGKDIRTVGHFGRHIPAEIRTGLFVQERECMIRRCSRKGYLEIDHIHDYIKRGPTALKNLQWLCSKHHARKSGGWLLGPPDPVTGKRDLTPPARTATSRAPPNRAA